MIIGASGGIGGALERAVIEEGGYDRVLGFARSRLGADHIDFADEATIAAAAARIADGPPLGLALIATGLLHDGASGPEKAFRDLDPDWLVANYRANAVGPALVLKHLLPILPRGGSPVVGVLSARVGSVSDNRLGGWTGYRAAKAALNMIVRNASIEAARTCPRSIVVALHPGTVDTALSKPFQANVAPGSLFPPDRAAVQLLDVLDALKPKDTGRIFAWDGAEIQP